MVSKPKRIKDPAAIRAVRKPYCEYCGRTFGPMQVHHIKPRGAGGDDVRENLICLCPECHTRVHAGEIPRHRLREIVERREHETVC